MTGTQQRAINLISKPPALRSTQEIDLLLPWLKKKSQLFESVEKHVIIDIIRNCQYECVERDHVIIKQSEKGDCFYIILNGTVSVFIDTHKSGEEEHIEQEQHGGKKKEESREASTAAVEATPGENDENDEPDAAQMNPSEAPDESQRKKPLDRSKYGKFVIKFESGRSFGEIALISDDSVRNASIIADETTDLLVIHRDLYNQTLKTFQEQEYRERRDFARSHPLFRQWTPRFRHLLEMSLIKEVFTYDTPIVRQGEPVNGLVFIIKGRAKVQVAPSRHGSQYPEMKPFKSSNDVYELELNRSTNKSLERRKLRTQQSLKQDLVAVRRNEGYAAAEKKMFFKNIALCSVEAGEVIGDIETIMGMETHLQTVTCTGHTEVYYLTAKNYERLITKRNPGTVDVLRTLVIRKLKSRANTKQGSEIPLLKHILFKLTEELKPVTRKMPSLKTSKELPERGTLFNHLLSVFVQNKAQLIEPHVPGAIYYREMMREKARIRVNVRNHTKRKEQGAMLKRTLRQVQHPRTIVALRNDLQRQIAQHQELENKWLLEELRAEERLQLQREFQRLKPLPDINESLEGNEEPPEAEPPRRLTTAERIAAEKLAAAEANGETSNQYGVFEMIVVRDRNVDIDENPPSMIQKAADVLELSPASPDGGATVDDVTDSLCASGNEDSLLKVAGSTDSRLETLSNPEARVTRQEDMSRRGAESAYAMFIPSTSDSSVFVTEMLRPTLPGTLRSLQGSLGDLSQGKESVLPSGEQGGLKFVSPLVRSKLNLSYENPEYRDWETSEKTLGSLEERIRNFALSPIGRQTLKPVQPPKLARFEKGDEVAGQPRPGGRVVIRRRQCPIAGREYNMPNHRHTRYRILPSIPNYDQMKKAKMLAYMTIDEERRLRLTQSEPSLNKMY